MTKEFKGYTFNSKSSNHTCHLYVKSEEGTKSMPTAETNIALMDSTFKWVDSKGPVL